VAQTPLRERSDTAGGHPPASPGGISAVRKSQRVKMTRRHVLLIGILTVLALLIALVVILLLTYRESKQILFEAQYARGNPVTISGIFIDSEGRLYSFENQMIEYESQLFLGLDSPPYSTDQLLAKYGWNRTRIRTIGEDELRNMEALGRKAAEGYDHFTNHYSCHPYGLMMYTEYLFEEGRGHTPIVLRALGEQSFENNTGEADLLADWLRELFLIHTDGYDERIETCG
jgi:hypothetical protein